MSLAAEAVCAAAKVLNGLVERPSPGATLFRTYQTRSVVTLIVTRPAPVMAPLPIPRLVGDDVIEVIDTAETDRGDVGEIAVAFHRHRAALLGRGCHRGGHEVDAFDGSEREGIAEEIGVVVEQATTETVTCTAGLPLGGTPTSSKVLPIVA